MNRWALMVVGIGIVAQAATAFAETGTVQLQGTVQGSTVQGQATLTDTTEGLQVTVKVSGVAPGSHGWHIHQFGTCGDAGNAAGGHYNPEGAPHGFFPKDGPGKAHPGDMGNIEVKPDGSGETTVTLPGVPVSSVAGRAIILHEKADDFGQPTGNAGGRIGCGPIVLTKGPAT